MTTPTTTTPTHTTTTSTTTTTATIRTPTTPTTHTTSTTPTTTMTTTLIRTIAIRMAATITSTPEGCAACSASYSTPTATAGRGPTRRWRAAIAASGRSKSR